MTTDLFRIDKDNGSAVWQVSLSLLFNVKIRSDSEAIYWWEQDYPTIFLRRLDSETGVIKDVTSLPSTPDLYNFYSDGSYVYWFISGYPYIEVHRALARGWAI